MAWGFFRKRSIVIKIWSLALGVLIIPFILYVTVEQLLLARTIAAVQKDAQIWEHAYSIEIDRIISPQGQQLIQQYAYRVAAEIALYLHDHPTMTVRELQQDLTFRTIAISKVGNTGYTAIFDSNTLYNRFHPNQALENLPVDQLSAGLPELRTILEGINASKESSGFYDWRDPDGSVRRKFLYAVPVKAETSDGVVFAVTATTYLDEFSLPSQRATAIIGDQYKSIFNSLNALCARVRSIMAIILVVFVISSVLLAGIFSRSITFPLVKLTEVADQISRGKEVYLDEHFTEDEVGRLSMTFNQMIKELKGARIILEERVKERTTALMAERDRNQRYLDLAGAIILVLDKEGKVTLLNKYGSHVLGYTQEELAGKEWITENIAVEQQAYVRDRIREITQEHSPVATSFELEIITKNGQRRLIEWHNSAVIDEKGEVSLICYGDDITVRRQMELEIKESKSFLNGIINSIPDPVFVKDKNHRFILVNQPLAAMSGMSPEEMIGKDDYAFFPKEEVEVFWNKDQSVLDSGIENVNQESLTGSDGLQRTIVTKKARFLSGTGDPYIVGVIRDITDIVRANAAVLYEKATVERRVRERTRELEVTRDELRNALSQAKNEWSRTLAIINSIGDGVFVLDRERKIVLVNPITEALSGYSRRELEGQVYTDKLKFVTESNHKENTAFVDEVYAAGTVSSMSNHTLLICSDGKELQVADSAAPLKDGTGNVIGCVVVFRDVSKAREVERMKDEFISIASHQLRTPLTALRWLTERLQKDPKKTLLADQQELVEDMRASTKRLITLVNDLLNISRIESGRIMVEPAQTDLKELVSTVVQDVSVRSNEKKQRITVEYLSEIPMVNIDSKLIRQAYQNIIVNAVKYSPENSDIMVRMSVVGEFIRSEVIDSGYGIPVDQQGRLFEKFFRANNITGKDSDGTGLGLYLVKKIIDVSGGTLGFQSPLKTEVVNGKTETRGTMFWFTLPLAGSTAQKGEVTLT
jgi:PAS domain S-box-containing protein